MPAGGEVARGNGEGPALAVLAHAKRLQGDEAGAVPLGGGAGRGVGWDGGSGDTGLAGEEVRGAEEGWRCGNGCREVGKGRRGVQKGVHNSHMSVWLVVN